MTIEHDYTSELFIARVKDKGGNVIKTFSSVVSKWKADRNAKNYIKNQKRKNRRK